MDGMANILHMNKVSGLVAITINYKRFLLPDPFYEIGDDAGFVAGVRTIAISKAK